MAIFSTSILSWLILATEFSTPPQNNTETPERLTDIVQHTLATNPQMQAARAQIGGGRSNLESVTAERLPDIGIVANQTLSVRPVIGEYSSAFVGLSGNYTLYEGGAVRSRVNAAEAGVDSTLAQADSTRRRLIFSAIENFSAVWTQQEILRVNQSLLLLSKEQAKAARNRFELGAGTKIDISQAEALMERSVGDVFLAEAQYEAEKQSFAATVGRPPKSMPKTLPVPIFLPTLAEMVQSARSRNPDLLRLDAEIRQLEARYEEARASNRPRLDFQMNMGYADSSVVNDSLQPTADFTLGLSVPITRVRRNSANVDALRYQIHSTIARRQSLNNDLIRDINSLWSDHQRAVLAHKAAEREVIAADEFYAGIKTIAYHGKVSFSDLSVSFTRVLNVRIREITLRQKAFLASYRLLYVSGYLTEEFLASSQPQLEVSKTRKSAQHGYQANFSDENEVFSLERVRRPLSQRAHAE